MNVNMFDVVVRGIITYLFTLLLTRLMGRKLISQMTFFDFVVGVSMESMAANLSIGKDNSIINATSSLITFTILTILVGYANIKSIRVRKIVNSEPIILIDKGNIVVNNMKRARITIDQLNMKLRENNFFYLSDVEFALLENDGKLSVLPKSNKAPLTPSDMNIATTDKGLMKDIIIDGNIINENLNILGLGESWLNSQLKSKKIKSVSEIFYAGVDSNKNLYLSKRSN